MKALPIQMQIEVLENAKASFSKYNKMHSRFGLCFHIEKAISEHSECPLSLRCGMLYNMLETYIPIFNKRNAYKFKALKIESAYWWPIEESKKRIAFLDWMINELKTELQAIIKTLEGK